jgi:hypothetical protein
MQARHCLHVTFASDFGHYRRLQSMILLAMFQENVGWADETGTDGCQSKWRTCMWRGILVARSGWSRTVVQQTSCHETGSVPQGISGQVSNPVNAQLTPSLRLLHLRCHVGSHPQHVDICFVGPLDYRAAFQHSSCH